MVKFCSLLVATLLYFQPTIAYGQMTNDESDAFADGVAGYGAQIDTKALAVTTSTEILFTGLGDAKKVDRSKWSIPDQIAYAQLLGKAGASNGAALGVQNLIDNKWKEGDVAMAVYVGLYQAENWDAACDAVANALAAYADANTIILAQHLSNCETVSWVLECQAMVARQ